MQLHPAVLLFAVLAMAATAFGFVGALFATPIAGIVAGFVEAFYLPRQAERNLDEDVQRLLRAG